MTEEPPHHRRVEQEADDFTVYLKKLIDYINSLIDQGIKYYSNKEIADLSEEIILKAKKWAIENQRYDVERMANQLALLIDQGRMEQILPEGTPFPIFSFGQLVEITGEGAGAGAKGLIDSRFFSGEPHNIWIYHITTLDGSGGGGYMTREANLKLIQRDLPGPGSAASN